MKMPRIAAKKARRGGSIVEFLLVVPTLMLILMGIIEFGKLYSDWMVLHQGARQGVRLCAIGKNTSDIKSGIRQASFSDITDGEINIEVYNSATSTWSTVSDSADGTSNNASSGYLVRVRIVSYPHSMVTGRFFSWLPNYSNGTIPISAKLSMRRE